jgi:hypothetical protein
MQNLGLSTSTPRTEGRLKSIFWPSIQNQTDIDYLGRQGFWLCLIPACESLVFAVIYRRFPPVRLVFLGYFLFYASAAIGIRERDRFAASAAFLVFLLSLIDYLRISAAGASRGVFDFGGVLNYFIAALLLANVRATWVAAASLSGADYTSERLNETMIDKFSDQMPALVWPVLRFVFAAAAVLLIGWLLWGQIRIHRV